VNPEDEPLEPVRTEPGAWFRRRSTKVLAPVGLAAILLVAALAVRSSDDAPQRVKSEASRSTTTDGASTSSSTSTSSASDDPSGSGGSNPTTAGPPPLQIEAVLLDEHPIIDSDLHVRLTITDGDGSLTGLSGRIGVKLEGGTITEGAALKPDFGPFAPCGEPGPSSVTMDVAVPYPAAAYAEQKWGRLRGKYAYTFGGDYIPSGSPLQIKAEFTAASSSACAQEETAVSNRLEVSLGFGNGPAAPSGVTFGEDVDPDPQTAPGPTGGLWSRDCDGIVDRIEVDWGDGSALELVAVNAYGCISGERWYEEPQHEYAVSGTYSITAVAVSVDDQGQREQRSSPATMVYAAP
jgi:hypothetical protein